MESPPLARHARPVFPGGMRRSFTLPPRPLSIHEKAGLDTSDSSAEILYSHPKARIVAFEPSTDAKRSVSTPYSREYDYPIDTVETLSRASSNEELLATGPISIQKVPGSTNFLNKGVPPKASPIHALMRNSQVWCVDGRAEFVLRVRYLKYERIELPYETDEDKLKVQQLKDVLKTILKFEQTPCPFKRGFRVDLPESALTPRRKGQWKRQEGSVTSSPISGPSTPLDIRKPRGSRAASEGYGFEYTPSSLASEPRAEIEDDLPESPDSPLEKRGTIIEADSSDEDHALEDSSSGNSDSGESPTSRTMPDQEQPPLPITVSPQVDETSSNASKKPNIPAENAHASPDHSTESSDEEGPLSEVEEVDSESQSESDSEESVINSGRGSDAARVASGSQPTSLLPESSEGAPIARIEPLVSDQNTHAAAIDPDSIPESAVSSTESIESDLSSMEQASKISSTSLDSSVEPSHEKELILPVDETSTLEQNSELEHVQSQKSQLETTAGLPLTSLSSDESTSELVENELKDLAREVPAGSNLDSSDNASVMSSADSFYSLSSLQQFVTAEDVDDAEFATATPRAESFDPLSTAFRLHRRDVSEITLTGETADLSHLDSPPISQQPFSHNLDGESLPKSRTLSTTSSFSAFDPQTSTTQPTTLHNRPANPRRSFSPLPPSSTLLRSTSPSPSPSVLADTSQYRSPGVHITGAILQKARQLAVGMGIEKPMQVVFLAMHVFQRIMGGATPNDLMSGELFRLPSAARGGLNPRGGGAGSGNGSGHRATLSGVSMSDEDDFGVPIRGRRKERDGGTTTGVDAGSSSPALRDRRRNADDDDNDSLFDLD